MWHELVGAPESAPPLAPQETQLTPPWWERLTPLTNDCEIALELLHCTPGEYYARTTHEERLLIKLHLAYRNKQRAMADRLAEARAKTQPRAPVEPYYA